MKVFITGGAGFIGGHLSETFLDARHAVALMDDLSTRSTEKHGNLKGRHGTS